MHNPGEVKFLVCVDSSDECKAALRFACMRAKNSKGEVCILYVIEPNDMQHFAGVEKVMEREAEEEANRVLEDLKKETFNYMPKSKLCVQFFEAYVQERLQFKKHFLILIFAAII